MSQMSRRTWKTNLLLTLIWPRVDKESEFSLKFCARVKELISELKQNNKAVNNSSNYHNNSSSTDCRAQYQWEKWALKDRAEQLAPNCQHSSPQKIPGNEKATCPTSSSSLSLTHTTFSFYPLSLILLCDGWGLAAMTVSALCLPPYVTNCAESALFYRKHFLILFISPLLPLLGIKQAKWGHAFKMQELWVYPSLRSTADKRHHSTAFCYFDSQSDFQCDGIVSIFFLSLMLNLAEVNF